MISDAFLDMAVVLSKEGFTPGEDFSYSPEHRQLLLGGAVVAWLQLVVPGVSIEKSPLD